MFDRPRPGAVSCVALLPLAASLAVFLSGSLPDSQRQESSGVAGRARTLLAGLLPAFEPLPGFPPGRAFGARTGNLALSVSAAEAVVRTRGGKEGAEVRFRLLGADPEARGEGVGLLPGRTHYLLGNRPEHWRRNVPRFEKARFTAVYPGIDSVFYGGKEGLEYDFVVQPGADPAQIRIEVEGAAGAVLDRTGDLILQTAAGELRHRRPVAYQEKDGRRVPVEADWVLGARRNTVSFRLGGYDPARALVIDPVLAYCSYLSGSSDDFGRGVAVDAQGFVYVALRTSSADLPRSATAFQEYRGRDEVYVAKLDLSRLGASALVFGTYLGGSNVDIVTSLAVDADGSVCAAGRTASLDYPTTASGFQAGKNKDGGPDGFVTRLDPFGAALVYSTYFGGSDADGVAGLALDGTGRIYLCGTTSSTDFPIKGPFQEQPRGLSDGFVAKLDSRQFGPGSLVYATYLGGTSFDSLNGIAMDASGRAVVTGSTSSRDYPTTAGGFRQTNGSFAPFADAVLSRLSASGGALDYSTYFGGSGEDQGTAVALDGAGLAYVAGSAGSTDLPVLRGIQGFRGVSDCFLARFNMGATGGASLLYSTYLGGHGRDTAAAVAVDGAGTAYLTGVSESGRTGSPSFPLTPQAFQEVILRSAFLSRIDPSRAGTASLRYSTAVGEPVVPDAGLGVAVDSAGTAYVIGEQSTSLDLPVTPGAFQATPQGEAEAFLIAVRPALPAVPTNPDAVALSSTQNRVTWLDRSSNETGFEIQRRIGDSRFARLGLVARDATSFTDTPPPQGPLPAPVFYRVRAVNEEGESPFAEARLVTGSATAPQDLQAFAFGSTVVGLTWTDSRLEAGYRVERQSLFGTTHLATLPANTTSFGDGSVGANSRYTYRVTAFNGLGTGAAEATVTVLAAPVNLDVTPVFTSAGQLRVTWEDRSGSRETGFELQRRQGSFGSFATVARLGANVTSFGDSNLVRSTTYSYRVRALAPNSFSSFSNTDSANTGRIPVAPTLVQAVAGGPDQVAVTWQDNSRFEAGFRVERRPLDGPFQAVGTVPPDATTFTDTGLEPRTTYRYRVFAFNDGGDSPSSNVAEVDTPGPLGGRLRITPERLNFGVVLAGQSRARQLTIRNAGRTEDLRVTLRVGEGPFRLAGPAELVLPPGESRPVKVRFRPQSGGRAQGRLVVESTDRQRATVRVPLTGWSYGLR